MAPKLICWSSLQSGHHHVDLVLTLASLQGATLLSCMPVFLAQCICWCVNRTALGDGQQPGQKSSSMKLCLFLSL